MEGRPRSLAMAFSVVLKNGGPSSPVVTYYTPASAWVSPCGAFRLLGRIDQCFNKPILPRFVAVVKRDERVGAVIYNCVHGVVGVMGCFRKARQPLPRPTWETSPGESRPMPFSAVWKTHHTHHTRHGVQVGDSDLNSYRSPRLNILVRPASDPFFPVGTQPFDFITIRTMTPII